MTAGSCYLCGVKIPDRDVAKEAARHQAGGTGYVSDDSWVNVVLDAGTTLWRGVGGPFSPYHFGANTTHHMPTEQERAEFWELAQVRPHERFGFRTSVAEYELLCAVPVARGVCSENWSLGWGGAEQFFIPEDLQSNLVPTGRTIDLA